MPRQNALGYGLISESLRDQLFPSFPVPVLNDDASSRVHEHYKSFGVALPVTTPPAVEHDWVLPKLQGSTLAEHFDAIGKRFAEPYDIAVRKLLKAGLPKMPEAVDIVIKPGWYMYRAGELPVAVDYPLEEVFVLDCETYVLAGAFPIIATCASEKAWYIWLDPALCDLSLTYEPNLYSIGDGKLLLGHNATYDFQRSIESHWLDVPEGKKRNYFICSMAMNIVCNGYSGPQRWVTMAKEVPHYAAKWAGAGCANSLVACYNFHCWPEVPLDADDKELRNLFVTCHLPEIRANFSDLIKYALMDVQYTFELFQALYPVYRQRRPSWVALAGSIQQSAHNLPVVDDWFDWIQRCEAKLEEYEKAIDKAGRYIADGVYSRFKAVLDKWQTDNDWDDKTVWSHHNTLLETLKNSSVQSANEYAISNSISIDNDWLELMQCPWLGHAQIDWSIRPRVKSGRGLPEWRRQFTEYTKSSRQLHMFLKIATRDNQPVVWGGRTLKWYYVNEDGKKVTVEKPGQGGLSGTALLNKDHAQLFDEGDLKVTSPGATEVLSLAMSMTYWISCRGRVMSEIVLPVKYKYGTANVICPSLIPTGTVSGRGVSPLWLTVTDCKPDNNFRIGVELKSRVQAPAGKVLMSADMSAQELRIGIVYADSIGAKAHYADTQQCGYIGASLMTHGVYAGNKELGTDAHTMLAKSVGVSRSAAKNAGYALLYGAGEKTIAYALMWDLVKLDMEPEAKYAIARNFAKKIIGHKRGKVDRASNVFYGGTDSAAFTVLAQLGAKQIPQTPLLRNTLTAPLCPVNCGNDFVTGRTNWSIQSTARDQADCFMVAYQWLCDMHNIDSRVIFLIHDEFLSITDEKDVDIAAWLFNVAHCWTWAYLNEVMGIYDMCNVGVFFDDVIAQKCLRKAADLKTNSSSNPVEIEDMPDGKVILEWSLPALHDLAVKRGAEVCPELYT